MATTWGQDNTGHDGRLYEIGTRLQNIVRVREIEDCAEELQKIVREIRGK
jgi:hypothetical protein